MKWVIDETGRFRWRPYFDQEELDIECEHIVSGFLKRKYGETRFPLSTDDLTVMIEQDTSELDLYADISGEGEDIEGLTDFFPHKKPVVKISKELSFPDEKCHRLRTTLAHEYGHVKFHTFLWDYNRAGKSPPDMAKALAAQRRKYNNYRKKYLSGNEIKTGFRCRHSRILDAPYSDWMEWQASYACGAFLIPLSSIRKFVSGKIKEWDISGWVPSGSEKAVELINLVSEAYDVSTEAAGVRLHKLGYLQKIHSYYPLSPGMESYSLPL